MVSPLYLHDISILSAPCHFSEQNMHEKQVYIDMVYIYTHIVNYIPMISTDISPVHVQLITNENQVHVAR
jgi:hypothetical protein